MFFSWDVTVPANTKEADPVEDWLELPKGIITKITVKFPAGCHGMVKLRLFKEALQVMPLSEDEWVTGDNEPVLAEPMTDLLDFPYKLKLIACSPDTTYDHKISLRIEVQEEEVAGIGKLTRLVQTLLDALGIETEEGE
jgi:hypothetical protein